MPAPNLSDFATATYSFVQAIGTEHAEDKCLKAVRSLTKEENYELFHLVRKQKKRTILGRKSTHFLPTERTVQMILEMDDSATEDKVERREETLASIETSLSFDAKGKASLAFLKAGVGGAIYKNTNMTVSWGYVKEEKLNIPQLEDMLQNRKVNMRSNFISQVKRKGDTLCIIVATYKNKEEAKITRFDKTGGSANANIPIDEAGATIGLEGSISFERHSTTVIRANRPIAYGILEILVRYDRSIELQMPGNKGGFQKERMIYTPGMALALSSHGFSARHSDPLLTPNAIKKCLQPLLTLSEPDLTSLRTSLIELLKAPEVLSSLNIVFQEACDYLIAGEVGQEKTREELLHSLADDLEGVLSEQDGMQITRMEFLESLGTDDIKCFKPLLEITGFVFKEDMIIYPTSDEKKILECSSDLLDSLTSLDEDQRGIFATSYSEKEKQEMMEMVECRWLQFGVRGNPVETPDTKLSLLLDTYEDDETRKNIKEKLLIAMCALW